MPLGVSQNTTLYFNVGSNPSDPKGPQPITLGKTQSGLGFLYMTGAELKLGSASPEWDSWIICDGAEYGASHPVLRWVGVVPTLINGAMQGLVTVPDECSTVRLFAEDPADPTRNMGSTC